MTLLLQANELGFPYWAKSFRGKRIIYDEEDELQEMPKGLFFLFKDLPFVTIFSHQEFFADEEMPKGLLTYQTDLPTLYINARLHLV